MFYYETDPDWIATLRMGYEVSRCDTGRHMRLHAGGKEKEGESDIAESLLQ